MRIEKLYKLFKAHYKIVKDTREDVNNAIYFSLKGESFNGNKYAIEAIENGANYAVIDEEVYQVDSRMILVDDVLKCLQDLARFHRQQLDIPILALTGSNGKTTTKELIKVVLNERFNCYATDGNLNNHIGVPLTLLSMTPDHDFGVVEMGANHLNEIHDLCNIALPDYGYITNFGRVHLEGFGSFEGVIKGKTEMYSHLYSHKKLVFVNEKDKIQMEYSKDIKRIIFGSYEADYQINFIEADPFVAVEIDGIQINSNLIGLYNYSNIAAAVAVGKHFGIAAEKIKRAIEAYTPDNNRSQIIESRSNKIILDAYNANPNSMEAALNNLAQLSDNHKVAILGDMFEIGEDTVMEHQKIASQALQSGLDEIFLIGEHFSKIDISNENIHQFKTFDKFKRYMEPQHYDNTTFLIKASRGMALERVLDLL